MRSGPMMSNSPYLNDTNSDSWLERLLLNLLSYTIVLVPAAVIIIATRYRLCPSPLQNNTLIRWFVYGNSATSKSQASQDDEDTKSLFGHPDNNESSTEPEIKNSNNSKGEVSTFLTCLMGLLVSYIIWGYLQEKIMTTSYKIIDKSSTTNSEGDFNNTNHPKSVTFHDSQFLVFMNRVVAFIVANLALVISIQRKPSQSSYLTRKTTQLQTKPGAPLYEYIYSSLSNIQSSWCQYEALKFVDFPTQCLSKSCKVIPVMLMSMILLKKKYPLSDYFKAGLLAAGMFIFLVNQPAKMNKQAYHQPNGNMSSYASNDSYTTTKTIVTEFSAISSHHIIHQKFKALNSHLSNSSLVSGLTILALYLTFDSFTSNWQQSLYSRYSITNWQMMAAINFYSILLTLTSLFQLGNLTPAFKLLASSPSLLNDCLLMSVMSAVGQMFVYYTIKRFGPVVFAVIMTLRQLFSILLSCAIYGHSLTLGSTMGLALVFAVVGYQSWQKYNNPKSNTKRHLQVTGPIMLRTEFAMSVPNGSRFKT